MQWIATTQLPGSSLVVQCLARGHLCNAQEENWHLSSYQSALLGLLRGLNACRPSWDSGYIWYLQCYDKMWWLNTPTHSISVLFPPCTTFAGVCIILQAGLKMFYIHCRSSLVQYLKLPMNPSPEMWAQTASTSTVAKRRIQSSLLLSHSPKAVPPLPPPPAWRHDSPVLLEDNSCWE